MGTRPLSAIEVSVRSEVVAGVTLSEENSRASISQDGDYEEYRGGVHRSETEGFRSVLSGRIGEHLRKPGDDSPLDQCRILHQHRSDDTHDEDVADGKRIDRLDSRFSQSESRTGQCQRRWRRVYQTRSNPPESR